MNARSKSTLFVSGLLALTTLTACNANQSRQTKIHRNTTVAGNGSAQQAAFKPYNSEGCLDLTMVVDQLRKNQSGLVRVHTKALALFQPSNELKNLTPISETAHVASLLKQNGDFKLTLESKRVSDLLHTDLFSVVAQSGCQSVTFKVPGTDRLVEYSIVETLKAAPRKLTPNKNQNSVRRIGGSVLVLESKTARKDWRIYQIASQNTMTIQTVDALEKVAFCGRQESYLARTILDFSFSSDSLRSPLAVAADLAQILVKHTSANENLLREVERGQKGQLVAKPRGANAAVIRMSESEMTDVIKQVKAGKMTGMDCETKPANPAAQPR